ncbi:hypothetical protein V1520DRAFT_344241 [Lipomyces starkeyi]
MGVTPRQLRVSFTYFSSASHSHSDGPLQALYPVEVLSYEQRAKGMALSSDAVNAAILVNQFSLPVAFERIQWHTYLIFVIWNLVQAVFVTSLLSKLAAVH